MCGIAAICGQGWDVQQLVAMRSAQQHRGPDDRGLFISSQRNAGLAHNRLSILDLSPSGRQPMASGDGRYHIVFNGEVYNYIELRDQLGAGSFKSRTDTEVILAALDRYGDACLDQLRGMFAFAVWDDRQQQLVVVRDRFGVKPVYYHQRPDGTLFVASEIKALHAAGIPKEPDDIAWATFLTNGGHEHSPRTFWKGIRALPPGHKLICRDGQVSTSCWYDFADKVGQEYDDRCDASVREEYLALLTESVRLRFRSDVPVGINLSGGLDSSTLLATVHAAQGVESDVKTFTFTTGDAAYDELPWVREMLAHTQHPAFECRLLPEEVPALAESVQAYQDEPFGGLPTLAYARLFEQARAAGVIVLLDGQGMDEQWAGYDYYAAAPDDRLPGVVQGTRERSVQPECLTPDFRAMAENLSQPSHFPDRLRNLQLRDTRYTKIPRVLRYNDRVSMRSSTELREPFLDHRLFELAFRQPPERKLRAGVQKWFLRSITGGVLPGRVVEAPKRALQTPQREWLRGPLRQWATDQIELALDHYGDHWLDPQRVRSAWSQYCQGVGDNSFWVWQWISIGLLAQREAAVAHA